MTDRYSLDPVIARINIFNIVLPKKQHAYLTKKCIEKQITGSMTKLNQTGEDIQFLFFLKNDWPDHCVLTSSRYGKKYILFMSSPTQQFISSPSHLTISQRPSAPRSEENARAVPGGCVGEGGVVSSLGCLLSSTTMTNSLINTDCIVGSFCLWAEGGKNVM